MGPSKENRVVLGVKDVMESFVCRSLKKDAPCAGVSWRQRQDQGKVYVPVCDLRVVGTIPKDSQFKLGCWARVKHFKKQQVPHKKNLHHFLLETWEQFVPNQTNNVLGRRNRFSIWVLGTHNCVSRDHTFAQQFPLCPLHPEIVPRARIADVALPSRTSYPSRYPQRICPYPPGKKGSGLFQS